MGQNPSFAASSPLDTPFHRFAFAHGPEGPALGGDARQAGDGSGLRGVPILVLLLLLAAWGSARLWSVEGAGVVDWISGLDPAFTGEAGAGVVQGLPPQPLRASVAGPLSLAPSYLPPPTYAQEGGLYALPIALGAAPAAQANAYRVAYGPGLAHTSPPPGAAQLTLPPALGPRPSGAVYGPAPQWDGASLNYSLPAGAPQQSQSGFSPASPQSTAEPPPEEAGEGKPDRWSVDAWAFLRQGSDNAPISQGRVPVYGASQTGSVLRYQIAPGSKLSPQAFARAYRALGPNGESEIAAGLAARPLREIPARLYGEVRVTQGPIDTDFRPALYAVSELPPFALGAGFSGEFYLGAGYVAGANSTAFADGQFVAMRPLANFNVPGLQSALLSFGGGIWGGAQSGAHRLDIGPSLRLDTRLGGRPARISVDWRGRVGGDAAPGSGIAATISTSF